MAQPKDFASVGILIKNTDDGTVSRVTESEMKKPVAVMKNTSTEKRWVQNIGTKTDCIMAPGSEIELTLEDLEAGVPREVKGTGVRMEKYDPSKPKKPHPMMGGSPGLIPVDARDSLPANHPSRKIREKMDRISRELGKPLCGKGSKEEVHRIVNDAAMIAEELEGE